MLGVDTWVFWATAAVMGVLVAAALWRGLQRGTVGDAPPAAYDLRVYRDQLQEVERDLGRGVIAATDAERLRTEISRRVLEADRSVRTAQGAASQAQGGKAVMALVVLLLAGSVAIYWRLGAPGYPDMPLKARIAVAEDLRQSRPSQAIAEADMPAAALRNDLDPKYLDLIEKLRAAVIARPDDLQGHVLLARNEAAMGNYTAAYAAQERVIALKAPRTVPEDQAILAELMIFAADGYVSPEAETALTRALTLNPENGTARYYSGVMLAQTGRPDLAFSIWRGLLQDSVPGDPWTPALKAQIEDMAQRAGVRYQLPGTDTPPGPSAADMANAAEMSDADRTAMIESMVARLSERLANEGGSAEEWARLIGAYGVLGQSGRAAEIWAEAQTRFAGRPDDLAPIRAAATQAGVAE
ncbi:MAG: c-type cytochrome biogenesis protein CcmI [Paracoccaceae bacterium]|nr:c-type cytochrome biogenesis protein CcmI [Paracoccaceae bacterium]